MAEKATHDVADYEEVSTHTGQFCRICEHFISPDGCTKVESPISPRGWCEWFKRE
jgi:hypothetical protein